MTIYCEGCNLQQHECGGVNWLSGPHKHLCLECALKILEMEMPMTDVDLYRKPENGENIVEVTLNQGWNKCIDYLKARKLIGDPWRSMDTAPKDRLIDILWQDRRWIECYYDHVDQGYRHITYEGIIIHLKNPQKWMPPPFKEPDFCKECNCPFGCICEK